jgi:Concanavalin A-like lectin/glucanases superfamily
MSLALMENYAAYIPDGAAVFVNAGLTFNQALTGAHIAAFDGATQWSVSAWIRSTGNTTFSQQIAAQGVGLSGNTFPQWTAEITPAGTGSTPLMRTIISTNSTTRAAATGSLAMAYGTLYHTLHVYDGTQNGNAAIMNFYLNGIHDTNILFQVANFPNSLISVPQAGLAVGDQEDVGDHEGWNGTLGHVCIWVGRALQQADATTLYNGGTPLSVDKTPFSLQSGLYCAFGFKSMATLGNDYIGNAPLTQYPNGAAPITWQSSV